MLRGIARGWLIFAVALTSCSEESSEGPCPPGQELQEGSFSSEQQEMRFRGCAGTVDGLQEGPWTWWYENGQKAQEAVFDFGKEEGPWTWWYENGQKGVEGVYKNGKKEGTWTWWQANGQKAMEGAFKNGLEDGLWILWHENGQKEQEGAYRAGKEEGVWTAWYEDGKQRLEGAFVNGKREGVWTFWDEDGQKEEVVYKDGKEPPTKEEEEEACLVMCSKVYRSTTENGSTGYGCSDYLVIGGTILSAADCGKACATRELDPLIVQCLMKEPCSESRRAACLLPLE